MPQPKTESDPICPNGYQQMQLDRISEAAARFFNQPPESTISHGYFTDRKASMTTILATGTLNITITYSPKKTD